MKLLKKVIRQEGINLEGKTIYRDAVRGVIIKGKKILMIYRAKSGDYKFPGGGVEEGETYEEALVREIKEETGATILSIKGELGKVIEYGIPREEDYDVFKMTSFYYFCEVDDELGEQSLEQVEKDQGFEPVWIDIDEAILVNQGFIDSNNFARWTPRETFILKYIKSGT